MKIYPEQITCLGSSRYRVRFKIAEPDEVREFEFLVDGDDVRVVVWSSDFAAFLRQNVGVAQQLLAAILALDRAQGVEVPTSL